MLISFLLLISTEKRPTFLGKTRFGGASSVKDAITSISVCTYRVQGSPKVTPTLYFYCLGHYALLLHMYVRCRSRDSLSVSAPDS